MRNTRKKLSLTDKLCEYSSYLQYNVGETSTGELRKRMKKVLTTAIEQELTERQRDCLRFYYNEGMKVKDIAQMMGLRPTTVYKHLLLAKKTLKKYAAYL